MAHCFPELPRLPVEVEEEAEADGAAELDETTTATDEAGVETTTGADEDTTTTGVEETTGAT